MNTTGEHDRPSARHGAGIATCECPCPCCDLEKPPDRGAPQRLTHPSGAVNPESAGAPKSMPPDLRMLCRQMSASRQRHPRESESPDIRHDRARCIPAAARAHARQRLKQGGASAAQLHHRKASGTARAEESPIQRHLRSAYASGPGGVAPRLLHPSRFAPEISICFDHRTKYAQRACRKQRGRQRSPAVCATAGLRGLHWPIIPVSWTASSRRTRWNPPCRTRRPHPRPTSRPG